VYSAGFFGFEKTPFGDSPDAKQLFPSQAWNRAKARLQFLADHHGAGLLTGEVGSGKSTAARTFSTALNPNLYKILYLHWTPDRRWICSANWRWNWIWSRPATAAIWCARSPCNGPQKLDTKKPFLRWWAALKMKESQCPERVKVSPTETWMTQLARNAVDDTSGGLKRCRYVLHDRDAKYCKAFDDLLASEGVECLRLPPRSPNLDAFAERWVRSVKEERLSRLVLFGACSLQRALTEFVPIIMRSGIIRARPTRYSSLLR
jgi:hypothetical protein